MSSKQLVKQTSVEDWNKIITEDTILFMEKGDGLDDLYQNGPFIKIVEFENFSQNGNVELQAILLNQTYKFKKIIAISEYFLLRAAQLREYLGIKGHCVNDILPFRDKVEMKKLAAKHNIPVPEYAAVETPMDLLKFIDKVSFPVIIKPFDGSGSLNTFKISNQKELEIFFNKFQFQKKMIAEKFTNAEIYHVDGIVLNQQIKLCSPAKYLSNCLDYLSGSYLGSYVLLNDSPLRTKLVEFTEKVINCFPALNNYLFHMEIFVDQDFNLALCEVTCRLGGNSINREVESAYGINIKNSYLEYEYGEEKPLIIKKSKTISGRLLMPPVNGILLDFPPEFPFDFIEDYDIKGKVGCKYSHLNACNDYLAIFFLKAKNETEMENNVQILVEFYKKHTKWG